MPFIATPFKDLLVFEPKVFSDARGYFFEAFNKRIFEEQTGKVINFVQDNQSKSSYGVLRGLHFQKGDAAQAKLVRVISGRVLDVVVDLRQNSLTFKQHFSIELSAENNIQLLIPRGFAHGFVVLSDTAEVVYKCDNYYDPKSEGGINYADPEIKIDWGVPMGKLIVAEKDRHNPFLSDYLKNL